MESNAQVLQAATEEIEQQRGQQQVVPDNRSRMNLFYQQQKNENPGNSATRLGYNFDLPSQVPESGKPAEMKSLQRFDEKWFDAKGEEGRKEMKDEAAAQDQQPRKKSSKRIGSSGFQRGQQELAAPEAQNAAQKVFSQSGQSGQVAQQMPQQRAGGKALDTQDELNKAYADKLGKQVVTGESVARRNRPAKARRPPRAVKLARRTGRRKSDGPGCPAWTSICRRGAPSTTSRRRAAMW